MEVEENCSPMQKRGRPSTNSPKISEEKDQFQEKDENMPKRKRKDSPFNPELPLEGMLQPERASASPLISNLGPPLLPNFEGLDMPGDVMGSLASFGNAFFDVSSLILYSNIEFPKIIFVNSHPNLSFYIH